MYASLSYVCVHEPEQAREVKPLSKIRTKRLFYAASFIFRDRKDEGK